MYHMEEVAGGGGRLLTTLQELLELPAAEVKSTLDEASLLVAKALGADKVDAFLIDPTTDSLVAVGTSATPMGIRQRELGLDKMPLANGGRTVEVYQTGRQYATGRADEDPEVLRGLIEGLGIHSMLLVPFEVNGERRGVLSATWEEPDRSSSEDLAFLQAVSRWVGMVFSRAELVERITHEATEHGRDAAARDIITVLAHDLGNYLTPLRGRIDLIKRRARREERERDEHDADAASHALLRAQRLVSDLLDTSRLDRGVFALEVETVDLIALVRDTAEMMQTPEAPIQVNEPDEGISLDGDGERIRRILENLVSNAIKYSPEEAPIVVTVGQESDENGDWAVVSVRDEGPGIPADMLPRIFRRFSSGANSAGLGLGLYLARGLARAHGGTLTAESTLGQGATFILRLPLHPPAPA